MARKVFQHFAQVLCQRFVEVPSNRDLINLAILGGGRIDYGRFYYVDYGDTSLNTKFNDLPSSWGLSEVSLITTNNPRKRPSGA